jgi:hypothetical protein
MSVGFMPYIGVVPISNASQATYTVTTEADPNETRNSVTPGNATVQTPLTPSSYVRALSTRYARFNCQNNRGVSSTN